MCMIFKTLDTIRQKPKRVRDQYAFGVAASLTLVIAGVWSLSLPSRFGSSNMASLSDASSTPVETAPFAGLIAQFKSQFQGMKAAIDSLPAATGTPSTTSTSSSALSETEAALNLQITEENRVGLGQSSSTAASTSEPFRFAEPVQHQTIMIATTSDQTTTAN